MAKRKPCLFDHVTLDDGSEGIIKFIGSLSGRDDVYYGVDLSIIGKHKFNNNNGSIKNIEYFKTSNGKNGRLCKKQSIKYFKLTGNSIKNPTYGSKIYVPSAYCEGIVKYMGQPPDKNEIYVGVELEEDTGDCDGTYSLNNAKYFNANTDCGIYVALSEISAYKQSNDSNSDKIKSELSDDKMKVNVQKSNDENIAIYQQQVYGNMSPKMKLDKNGNKTYESGTEKNKIVTTVMAVNSGIDSGNNGGSVKDRMAMWNKKKVTSPKTPKTPKEEKSNGQSAANERLRLQKEKAEKLKKEKEQREKQKKVEAERLRKEQMEKERLQKMERQRKAKEEQERMQRAKLEKEKKEKSEAERLKKEKEERLKREKMLKQREEAERIRIENIKKQKEAERIKAEKEQLAIRRLQQEEERMRRIEKKRREEAEAQMKKEKQRTLREEQMRREREEKERQKLIMEEKRKEKARRQKEEAEKQRLAKLKQEKEEKERLQRLERERKEKEERLRKAEAEKLRLEKEKKQKAEAERLKKEKEERLRRAEMERLRKEKEAERIRLENLRKQKEAEAEKQRLAKLQKEKEEKAKLEKQRKEKEEKLRLSKERAAKAKKEREERAKQQKLENERKQKLEKEEKARLEKQRKEKEEKLRLSKERAAKAKKEREEREKQQKLEKERKQKLEKEKKASSGVDSGSIYNNDEYFSSDDDEDDAKAMEMRRKQEAEEEAELKRQIMERKKKKAQESKQKQSQTKSSTNGNTLKTKKKQFAVNNDSYRLNDMMAQMNAWKNKESAKQSPKNNSNANVSQFKRNKSKSPKANVFGKKGRKFSNAPNAKGKKYTSKDLEIEIKQSFGKNLDKVTMVKLDEYTGDIPLVLYLLGNELYKANKFGTFKLFEPEQMQNKKGSDRVCACAWNIYSFFASMPTPLLDSVDNTILNKAISKDVMSDVCEAMDEPYASTLCYLWDLLACVAMQSGQNKMGQQALGKVFGPMCTMVTSEDMKGNRVSMNVLAASRMMAMFRRGIEWRMEVKGYNFDSSDDDDSD